MNRYYLTFNTLNLQFDPLFKATKTMGETIMESSGNLKTKEITKEQYDNKANYFIFENGDFVEKE